MAEDFVTTGGEEFDPEDAGRRAREAPEAPATVKVHRWQDSAGKVWVAVSGKRRELLLGSADWVTKYPHIARMRDALEFAILSGLLWKVWAIAADLHVLMMKELHR